MILRLVAATLLLFALAGCAQEVETDQARLCRMALPALSSPDADVHILGQLEQADARGVEVAFQDKRGGARRVALCRFRLPGRPLHSTDLVELSIDGQKISEPRLFFLIRFWLATPDGRAGDPAPLGDIEALPRVPPRVAYLLQQAVNALPQTAVYALLASAYSLIYGLVGRINLAFGALAATGGYAAAFGASLAHGAPPGYVLMTAGVLGVVVAAGWGAASGRWAFGPLAGATGQQTLVATVGLAIFLSELLRLTQGVRPNWVAPVLNAPFGLARADDFVVTTSADALFSASVALGAGTALVIVMQFSRFGREWRAYADNSLAAAMFGIDPRAIFLKTFGARQRARGAGGLRDDDVLRRRRLRCRRDARPQGAGRRHHRRGRLRSRRPDRRHPAWRLRGAMVNGVRRRLSRCRQFRVARHPARAASRRSAWRARKFWPPMGLMAARFGAK